MEMIGQKIKELRLLKGYTQEDLAERTNLSVRTIQRIENGEVDPRTYTLNLLAEALDVALEEFTSEIVEKEKLNATIVDHTQWLALLHLSGLFIMIFPPLILYIWKKPEIPEMQSHFKEVMNFQLSMLVYLLGATILIMAVIGLLILPLLGLFSTAIIILNTIKVMNGDPYKYPLIIKFLK